jgi:hypothetical protein
MSGSSPGNQYYLRKASVLIGSRNTGDAVDVSALHFRFTTSLKTTETPNILKLHIWNLSQDTLNLLTKQNGGTFEYSSVTLSAGYQAGPYGLLFQGNVLYMRAGRESPVDTYLDIDVADGDQAYNFAVVNATIPPGATQKSAAQALDSALQAQLLSPGQVPDELADIAFPRGLSLFGMCRDHAAEIAANNGMQWSIQDGQSTYLAEIQALSTVVELNAQTGMIGIPEQTIYGINVRSLLNPNLKPGITLKLNNADIKLQAQNTSFAGATANAYIAPINSDGLYKILAVTFEGDSRGNPWYANIICNDINQPTSFGAVQSKWVD